MIRNDSVASTFKIGQAFRLDSKSQWYDPEYIGIVLKNNGQHVIELAIIWRSIDTSGGFDPKLGYLVDDWPSHLFQRNVIAVD